MDHRRGQPRQGQLPKIAALALVLTTGLYLINVDTEPVEVPLPPLHKLAGKMHVLVTGGAGYIGSHATLRLLEEGHTVTIIDNLSRGNLGAIKAIRENVSNSETRLRFVEADLGDKYKVFDVFARSNPPLDAVIHFAAVAYVGESMAEPNRYYHNITSNTVILLEAMDHYKIQNLVYSSTCATYGNALKLPITEETPTEPINPYGRAKLMAERAVRDYAAATPEFRVAILRYFNVFGSDPLGRVGELPRADLRQHSRISGACFDAALGFIPSIKIMGTKLKTKDGTCIRDYIHVTDLVDAHIAVLPKIANPPVLYNVGTGKGVSVRQFVNACKKVTGANITVIEQVEPRPGDYAEVWADPKKIKKELNWTAKYTDIEESMRHAWSWRQNHKSEY